MDGAVEQIDPDEGEVRGGLLRLLHESGHSTVVVDLGDAERAGVRHLRQQDLSGGRPRSLCRLTSRSFGDEPLDEGGQTGFEHVVAEVHDEFVVAEIVACDEHAVGQPERLGLGDPGDTHPEVRAVTDRLSDLGAGGRRDDDADVGDPGRRHLLDAVEQDGFVGDGHQLLGAGMGDRAQALAGAAAEDQAFHFRSARR